MKAAPGLAFVTATLEVARGLTGNEAAGAASGEVTEGADGVWAWNGLMLDLDPRQLPRGPSGRLAETARKPHALHKASHRVLALADGAAYLTLRYASGPHGLDDLAGAFGMESADVHAATLEPTGVIVMRTP